MANMNNYQEFIKQTLEHGVKGKKRNDDQTISMFGGQLEFDLSEGFPLYTGRKIALGQALAEHYWFISGSTNRHDLNKLRGCKFWDEFENSEGDVGPLYGRQWRKERIIWNADPKERKAIVLDPIKEMLAGVMADVDSRRYILSAYNYLESPLPEYLSDATIERNHAAGLMSIGPCHTLSQYSIFDGKLNCHLYMRSSDICIGLPYNIAGYAIMLALFANVTKRSVGKLVISFGDRHIYGDHIAGAKELISRQIPDSPTLDISDLELPVFTGLINNPSRKMRYSDKLAKEINDEIDLILSRLKDYTPLDPVSFRMYK